MKTRSTKQLLIFFSVLVAVLIGLHFVLFAFIRNAGVTVTTLESDVTSLQAQVVEFSKYSPEDMRKLAQSVTEKIIPRDGFAMFLERIEAAARTENMEILIRSVTEQARSEDPAENKEVVMLNIETRGSWASNMKFLNYLEHLPYKVELQRVALGYLVESKEQGKETVQTKTWRTQIEMTVLKFK